MFSEIIKEIKELKEICRENGVVDIVLLRGNGKEKVIKINLTIIFRDKKTDYIDKILLKVKEIFNKKQIKTNLNFLLANNILKEPIYLTLIQSGFSINQNKFICKSLNIESIILVTYDLKILNHSKKTLFGYALKGRKGQKGFLDSLNGSTVGRNNILVPINKLDALKEFLKTWQIKYSIQKFMRINEEK